MMHNFEKSKECGIPNDHTGLMSLVGIPHKLLSLECLDRQIELNLDEARPDI